MPAFSFSLLRRAAGVLAGLCLGCGALAQTAAPAWLGASATGNASTLSNGSSNAVDGAGNLYEIGNFSGTTVVAGTTLTSQGDNDGYLAKYTPTGALAWVRQLGSPELELLLDVAVDAAGNVYVAGYSFGSFSLGNSVAVTSISDRLVFAVRYSPQGIAQWAQQTTTSAAGGGIGADAAGNVYLIGTFNKKVTIGTTTVTASGTNGTFLARLSGATGAVQSLLPTFYYSPVGTSNGYQHTKLAVAATGAVYLLAGFYEPANFSSTLTLTSRGSSDVLVARYSPQGAFEWASSWAARIAMPSRKAP